MSLAAGLSRQFSTQIWKRQHSQIARGGPLLNQALRHLQRVRLISQNGEDWGLMHIGDALQRARQAGLDLMQVSKAETSVVRLVDYAAMEAARRKSEYESKKKNKESKLLNRREGILKQIRLSPATDRNDTQTKMRQAKEFLKSGYRVKIYMQFRRGQGRLKENAKTALVAAAEELQNVGIVQGLEKGKGLQQLFMEQKEEEEEGVVKKKPLEFFLRPLPRKQREQQTDKS